MAGIVRRVTVAGLLALALGAVGAEAAVGQASLLGPGAGFIGGGISGIETGGLDDRLAARGYPTFGRTAGAVSLGAYRVLSSGVMLGGEWHGLIIGEEVHQGRDVGLGGGYATLGVGYAVELSPRLRVYPRLGLGAGGLALWIENEADTVGFDEVLADPRPLPGRQPVLSRDGVVADLGAGAELLPGGRGRGPLIGLRVGYLVAGFGSATNWQLYEYTASDGPSATIAGPYVRVVVGVGWGR
ncbi:MAG TPA: outer membrane beta-barrel protein [Gemmatimonadales bacterium]|nr:outer membrane beta-barrel protein [Gemmatimonadales bacterium]